MTPAANERMVGRCYRRMIEATEFGFRMHWWQRMQAYIRRRTPSQVFDLERLRGLR